MIPVRKLVSTVCVAVKELRDAKGSSLNSIAQYIKQIVNGRIATVSVRKAATAAVENKLLKQTRDGRYKLNVLNTTDKDASATVEKSATVVQPTDCLPKSRGRKRSGRSHCGRRGRSRKGGSRRSRSRCPSRMRRKNLCARRSRHRSSSRSYGSHGRHKGRSSRRHHRSRSFSSRRRHRSGDGNRRRRFRRCADDDTYN